MASSPRTAALCGFARLLSNPRKQALSSHVLPLNSTAEPGGSFW